MARKRIPKHIKDRIEVLSKGTCEYCKLLKKFSPPGFATEHINPLFLGGSDKLENLAEACFACNMAKHTYIAGYDPITKAKVNLFNPRKDDWHLHFKWSDDLLEIIGLTPIGRATINRLKMNREETKNLRKVLIGHGHPPNCI